MSPRRQVNKVKPAALRRGDKVGIVAPASHFKREDSDADAALRRMGYTRLRRLNLRA
jgi:muramoyltetrapeptide carboxypeptidase LdcA involved in peptidoglycan recycling